MYTQAEALKEIRAIAKKNGLTFKKMNKKSDGVCLWMFTNRKTGQKILENCRFWTAYADCQSGYLETL
jgi:hypothetical protein